MQPQIFGMMSVAVEKESADWQPFVIEIPIETIDVLISNCLTKEPQTVCQNMKDAHMNTIGEDFILTSMNKNAHIIRRSTGALEKELDLKNREMSSSLVCKDLLYIGTYVDTLFIFSIPDFEFIQLVRTHDSLLSMCSISESRNIIAVG